MKLNISILLLLLLNLNSGFSQSFELGGGLQFYKFSGRGFDNQNNSFLVSGNDIVFNILGGKYFPLKKLNENFTFGLQPNAMIGLYLTTLPNSSSVTVDIPVYAALKWGAGSSDESESKLGLGLGAGIQGSFAYLYINSYYYSVPFRKIYPTPTFMGEFSFSFDGYYLYKLRVDVTPRLFLRSQYFQGYVNQLNLRIIRTF